MEVRLPNTYMLISADVGSGSTVRLPHYAFGKATAAADPGFAYYAMSDFLSEHSHSSVPVLTLRETSSPVGSWLASMEGVLAEVDSTPPGVYARALDQLKEDLGVTLTYVARCLGMQRSAVYRWYDKGRQPHAGNRSRLKTLQEFASAWRAARLPSLRTYWDTQIPDEDATLGQLLSADTVNINSLRAGITRIAAGAGKTAPTRPRLGFPGRKRDRVRERDRLNEIIPSTSHESD